MHADYFHFDEADVRRLLAEQVPRLAELPLRRVESSGTDNAIYRLGDELVVRIPRRASAVALLKKELDWLPSLDGLPLEVPRLRFRGSADLGMVCDFGILDWMEGQIAQPQNIADPHAAAFALAAFLQALHHKETDGAPEAGAQNSHRGVALQELSTGAVPAILTLADEIDAHGARTLWDSACAAEFQGRPVWLHGDLKADNLIAREGKLHGVIDWGLSAVGDPAADYATAWFWIDPSVRDAFRGALDLDDQDWLRAKGWALYGAVIALSYYRGGRNEALCRQSRLTLSRLGLMR
jgi:aminoglycoside phosphotransferase (APT) family kinase protein